MDSDMALGGAHGSAGNKRVKKCAKFYEDVWKDAMIKQRNKADS